MSDDSSFAQGDSGASRPLRVDARRNRARILDAAEVVFAERGRSAKTEDVAARAGVAIGTVFRHFPTKEDLLRAILKRLLTRMTEEIGAHARESDPGSALFSVFARLMEEAAQRRSVIELLDQGDRGDDGQILDALNLFAGAVAELLNNAQRVGTVDPGVEAAEVMALLTSTCQGALRGGWDAELRRRILAVIFAGLRPRSAGAEPGR